MCTYDMGFLGALGSFLAFFAFLSSFSQLGRGTYVDISRAYLCLSASAFSWYGRRASSSISFHRMPSCLAISVTDVAPVSSFTCSRNAELKMMYPDMGCLGAAGSRFFFRFFFFFTQDVSGSTV